MVSNKTQQDENNRSRCTCSIVTMAMPTPPTMECRYYQSVVILLLFTSNVSKANVLMSATFTLKMFIWCLFIMSVVSVCVSASTKGKYKSSVSPVWGCGLCLMAHSVTCTLPPPPPVAGSGGIRPSQGDSLWVNSITACIIQLVSQPQSKHTSSEQKGWWAG